MNKDCFTASCVPNKQKNIPTVSEKPDKHKPETVEIYEIIQNERKSDNEMQKHPAMDNA